jgi:hypothetical protein
LPFGLSPIRLIAIGPRPIMFSLRLREYLAKQPRP